MCGICVVWNRRTLAPVEPTLLLELTDTLAHRGPDDSGYYFDPKAGIGFGFQRLAILDLSPMGHQPMSNEDGTLWIIFNGEIYNYLELRPELEQAGHVFRSHTDTEVILHAYEEWGARCVQHFIGMFSFVIWDERQRALFGARDRVGIKPFYYADCDGQVVIASELKPIIKFPHFDRALSTRTLREYLREGYVSPPNTIFQSARALPPGYTLQWGAGEETPRLEQYWKPRDYYRGAHERAPRAEAEWVEELDALLRSAVKYRLLSDVPLGAFLSGGIDSSLIVALMRQVSAADIKTFTIGFAESAYNEANFAATIAKALGAEHMPLTLTQPQARQVIADLAWHYDEPFADSSQIPTLLVSKLTREYVTVALSGDGGDELFCGYQKYQQLAKWQAAWLVPESLRQSVSQLARVVPNDRLRLAATGLTLPDAQAFAQYYTNLWRPHEVDQLIPDDGMHGWNTQLDSYSTSRLPNTALLDQLMLDDLQHYLPNDILTKVDRASMAVSLEARVPLLDHRVVEFAMRLPLEFKWRDGKSKYILRRVLSRYLPEELFTRPKHGFGIPLDHWLRNELRNLLDQYLSPARLNQTGLFDAKIVQAQVQRFLRGECGHARVWSLLMFQMWLERFALSSVDIKT